jgi:EAL domain-containing protein (putative c-di-GMP-specific phosphodiesterase class I)
MSELDVVERVLSGLCALGVELSVDDFGTGYSSMTFLSRTTLQELKIDRSFVAGLMTSTGDAAIVRATIELARSFGLRVVAEGIETQEQLKTLLTLGCRYGQGYHIARPMPAIALRTALLASAAHLTPTSN